MQHHSSDIQSNPLPDDRVSLIYIAGMFRSGSTLLDLLLGTAAGVHSTGELKFLWERSILDGEPCACGKPYQDCQVWGNVLTDKVLAGPPIEIAERVVSLQRSKAISLRHTRKICRQVQSGNIPPELEWYRDLHVAVYERLLDVTGANTIVDSTKFPQDAALLATSPKVNLRLVHLVRDPRGVVASYQRGRPLPKGGYDSAPRKTTLEAIAFWSFINLASEWVADTLENDTITVIYEKLASNPDSVLAHLSEQLNIPEMDSDLLYSSSNHTIGGNAHRFRKRPRKIRLDDKWKRELGPWTKFLTSVLTSPQRMRYS